jgi:hypothetical protein
MRRAAGSTSRFAAGLIAGTSRRGVAVGHGYARFDNDVLALTPRGAPRMPNGIETDVVLTVGEQLLIGDGQFCTASAILIAGPPWEARPSPRVALTIRPDANLAFDQLSGWGPGLTPLGDDILVGYTAAAALAGAPPTPAASWGDRTTALSRTLLALAALGELPEPAHRLLEDGNPQPLLRFGSTSGKGIIVGLAAAPASTATVCDGRFTVALSLPDGPQTFEVFLSEVEC